MCLYEKRDETKVRVFRLHWNFPRCLVNQASREGQRWGARKHALEGVITEEGETPKEASTTFTGHSTINESCNGRRNGQGRFGGEVG